MKFGVKSDCKRDRVRAEEVVGEVYVRGDSPGAGAVLVLAPAP